MSTGNLLWATITRTTMAMKQKWVKNALVSGGAIASKGTILMKNSLWVVGKAKTIAGFEHASTGFVGFIFPVNNFEQNLCLE